MRLRYIKRMTKTDFKLKVFSLSERLFPLVARLLGDKTSAEDAIQEIKANSATNAAKR